MECGNPSRERVRESSGERACASRVERESVRESSRERVECRVESESERMEWRERESKRVAWRESVSESSGEGERE